MLNEIFPLRLSSGALAVYSYLLYCEDRKTYQRLPSYRSIGKAVRMSVDTVRKYIAEREETVGRMCVRKKLKDRGERPI